MRRWVLQAQIEGGQGAGATSEELAETKALKAENRRLREDVETPLPCNNFVRRAARPPQPLIMGFVDTIGSRGPRGRVDLPGLREQGC